MRGHARHAAGSQTHQQVQSFFDPVKVIFCVFFVVFFQMSKKTFYHCSSFCVSTAMLDFLQWFSFGRRPPPPPAGPESTVSDSQAATAGPGRNTSQMTKELQGANTPPGMYPTRKSTSVPDLLRRMRARNQHVTMPTLEENFDTQHYPPAKLLLTTRCRLSYSPKEKGVKVILQILKDSCTTYIKIFRHHVCVLHLDRRLLRFSENADRLQLALTAKDPGYDWWVLIFDKEKPHAYYDVHYHILQEASL